MFVSIPTPKIRRWAGIARAGPEPARNAGRAPPADFPHSSAALRCVGRTTTKASATSPLHLARTKPARRACLGHQTIAGSARTGNGKAPPIIPSGP